MVAIFLSTPLIYTRKRIRDIGNPYGIPVFTLYWGLTYPSITISTYLLVKKGGIYSIKLLLIPKSGFF